MHHFGASNAWAVAGARAASGKPLLAADPHLDLSLPAVWYQVEGSSPGYQFAGVTIPGIPVPALGRTDTLSWGITDAQRPTTLFYLEKTDAARPGQYHWRGAWHRMDTVDYQVAVRGEGLVPHTVELTAQGPVVQLLGRTTAVWWAGTLPSQNVASVLSLLRARDVASFRESLRGWATPAVNFVYADRAGNIGAFDVGVAPQVAGHPITLPLPGDGSADVAGSIPDRALPHVVNPPSGYVVSANQREVGAEYPYQYATSYNFSDEGWRADAIVGHLSTGRRFTAADFQRLQGDQHDQLAAQLVPQVRRALAGQPLSPTERQVAAKLSGWDAGMEVGSIAPTVLQNLANHLVYLVFRPWWSKFKVPKDPDDALAPRPFAARTANEVLEGTVLAWIRHDPTNPFLTPPGGPARDASAVLRQAFHETVTHLIQKDGGDLAKWTYGSHHDVVFKSLLQSSPLDDGPYSRGGDSRTVNAAGSLLRDGRPDSDTTTAGASWRFVIDWGSGSAASVYPGGQSESPLSPWYGNGVPLWRQGALWPMHYGPAGAAATRTTWRLRA